MKKVLFIGSTVADVIIHIDRMPRTAEDVNVSSQTTRLGGCAYNAFHACQLFDVPAILFSPIGTGVYGDFVRKAFDERGIQSPIPPVNRDNGCCYCFIEPSGERTFICHQEAEYYFEAEWFDLVNQSELAGVYVCGLEIHDKSTAGNIVTFLEPLHDIPIYFAPSPHICEIDNTMMARILACHPILHVNEREATSFAKKLAHLHGDPEPASIEDAAQVLQKQTSNTVIITLGAAGALLCEKGKRTHIPGLPAKQVDTTGAGDSHIGSIIARRYLGDSFADAVAVANRVSAAVVEHVGAQIEELPFA
ncbi:MAG: carbohydrate kinase [Lachnospiraceae bacterium]|nr:carbohydrate kinase [Lachnospiraceae bacterium]